MKVRSNKTRILFSPGILLLSLAGCTEGPMALDESEVERKTLGLTGATFTTARPEIGSSSICGATLIAPRYVLSASHCNAHLDTLQPDAWYRTDNEVQRQMTRIKVLGAEDWHIGAFNPDVALLQLDTPIPAATATPAVIASLLPVTGQRITRFGFMHGSWFPDFQKTYISWDYVAPHTDEPLKGDSGYPAVFGNLNDNGAIWGVASHRDGPQDVWGTPGRFKEQIAQIMRLWEGTGEIEVGIDRPGMDLSIFSSPNASSCRQSCILNNSCRAFTHFNGQCYLKKAIPDWRPCVGCSSGIRPTQEVGIDRPGGDISDFNLSQARPEHCMAYCARNDSCAAYTYAPPGLGGNPWAHCWLKGTPQTPVVQSGGLTLVSGLKANVEVGVDRPGANLQTLWASSAPACAKECAKNGSCRAYSFVPASGTCYLKSQIPPPVFNAAVSSGMRKGVDLFMDRVGSDITSFVVEPPSVEICQAACEANSSCLAFEFLYLPMNVNPPPVDNNAICYLKSAIPDPVQAPTNANYQRLFSGIKGLSFF